MRKQLVCVAVIGTALALVAAGSALGKREVAYVGTLFLADNGRISPSKLPKNTQAPISATINGEIGTTDGSHPPAVRTLVLDIDKTFQVNAKGLPTCSYGQITNSPTEAAKKACPDAIVGSGVGQVEVAFPDAQPFTGEGQIVLFNGGVHGGTTLLFIHAYVAIPAPTAVVAAVKITRIHQGVFGLHTVTQVPRIAGGFGSVTAFKLKIGRTFTYKGKKQSYLTASCPTGHYYTKGNVLFSDGTSLGLTHVLPCTPTG